MTSRLLFLCLLVTPVTGFAGDLKIMPFKTKQQAERVEKHFVYALSALDRGVPKESEQALRNALPSLHYDRRLYGYARVAVTYFELGKVDDAKAIIRRILSAIKEDQDPLRSKFAVAEAYLDAKRYEKAEKVLEELTLSSHVGQAAIVKRINLMRTALALGQYDKAAEHRLQARQLLDGENQEAVTTFEFSLDTEIFDSMADTQTN